MRAEIRRKEYQREDNKKLVAQERIMRANVACDERVENKRFIRRLQQVIHVNSNFKHTALAILFVCSTFVDVCQMYLVHVCFCLLVCLFVCCESRRRWNEKWKRR